MTTLKLNRLKSIANNAVRDAIWTYQPHSIDPFRYHNPLETIVVDLVSGTLKPDREGDSFEEFYTKMSRWFHDVLKKEGIPIEVIESATITIIPGAGKKCVIVAEGRTFESSL
ncbi:MAG: hypothetical protein ACFFE2_16830 [Candidatus Thorarchaeota archaeon]